MAYEILQPPFTLEFRTMPKAELDRYHAWFMSVLPSRISELERAVRASPAFSSWRADGSPGSLGRLGAWFASQVETRPRTAPELTKIRGGSRVPMQIPPNELTDRSISLAVDIAMYFSEVLLKKASGLRWEQDLVDRRSANYGQPVLVGRGPVPLNPVRVMTTLAYALADKSQGGDRLAELYRFWSADLASGDAAHGS